MNMAPEKNFFSREGLKAYQKKLQVLKDRAKKAGKLVGAEAGDQCDWHDNFGFEQARREFERDSQRVNELQLILANVQIVEIQDQIVRVAIGNTLELNMQAGKKEITIGAWGESDPKIGLISYAAPLAKAVLGKSEGDESSFRGDEVLISKIHPASYKYISAVIELFKKMAEENQENQG